MCCFLIDFLSLCISTGAMIWNTIYTYSEKTTLISLKCPEETPGFQHRTVASSPTPQPWSADLYKTSINHIKKHFFFKILTFGRTFPFVILQSLSRPVKPWQKNWACRGCTLARSQSREAARSPAWCHPRIPPQLHSQTSALEMGKPPVDCERSRVQRNWGQVSITPVSLGFIVWKHVYQPKPHRSHCCFCWASWGILN